MFSREANAAELPGGGSCGLGAGGHLREVNERWPMTLVKA
jgi:hypothetical protein